ncbi:hypothetical protein WPS_12950 [Vulcanimicrobium alpinum]|uniref:protein-glutamate O-methyltransferase n=1 Tax=Vulcanimicrobium alpinum TaxID=3016050 RepID=A0AAN1XV89_UNVUL|nr:CheR family methyltransferase [Vulcanimicrobium alpinum]BDE06019.1 hypothetical protein WPS_12950 [Vulcanimicrobium alpinum]
MLEISDAEFVTLRDLVRARFGIWYDDQKRFLPLSRLSTRVVKRGFDTYGAYVRFLRDAPKRESEWNELASILSNNETYFFRERAQLKTLAASVLDEFLARSPRVRLWSAACSSGEEPYSLAMTLIETGKVSNAMLSIRATDISPRVLELAAAGYYRALSFRATDRRWRALRPGGYLFLGHAESLFHLTDLYEPVIGPDAIVYRLKAAPLDALRVTA